jgi:hypothetical protein
MVSRQRCQRENSCCACEGRSHLCVIRRTSKESGETEHQRSAQT